jgi:dTDP-4-amino-4,6-dideoxygalactose transaminase
MKTDKSAGFPSDADRTGRDLGQEELELLRQALASGTLTCTKGTLVARLEKAFASRYGATQALACTSGSAAVHCAIAALDPEPGDEIITTPITDMGALTPILYQGAIPIFCDVDPDSYNVTAETIEARISPRTRAVIATHLFGAACEMESIVELCNRRGILVIEDCAQAFEGTYRGRRLGTFGTVGCFSFQQGKHMTTGEGGMVIANDSNWARRIRVFINKAWDYGGARPDHEFLALNYRMNELTGAVALAQLEKLAGVVARRRARAVELSERIGDLPGLTPQKMPVDSVHSYWKYCLNIDPDVCAAEIDDIASHLRSHGIFAAPRYIGKPAFECRIFRERKTFGRSQWPYTDPSRQHLPEVVYDRQDFPGVCRALSRILVLPWNEHYTSDHVEAIAQRLREVVLGSAKI